MKLVEFPAAGAEYEMTYNQKEPLTMLSEYSFAYKRGETIISLEKQPNRANGTSSSIQSLYIPVLRGLLQRACRK